MMPNTSELELPERLRRLMRLGGDAAAQDADTATYATLDGSAREPATEGMLGLMGEIRQWHLDGRPDEDAAGKLTRMRIWSFYQARAAETGVPVTLLNITPDDLADRLEDLENDDDF